jgi:hypothetical protein
MSVDAAGQKGAYTTLGVRCVTLMTQLLGFV